jgi:hypothetical protein
MKGYTKRTMRWGIHKKQKPKMGRRSAYIRIGEKQPEFVREIGARPVNQKIAEGDGNA